MLPRLRSTAFQIPARDPARPQPIIEIRGPDGSIVDGRQDRFAVPGPRGWTEVVRTMGYKPITRWTTVPPDYGPGAPPGAAHMCKVEPAPVVDAAGYAAAHLAAGLLPTCPASTVLTKAHAEQLGGWEFGLRAGDVIECEYVGVHRPPHTGLGQPGRYDGVDERKLPWIWLLWSGEEALLTEAMLCGLEGRALGTGGDLDPCVLPFGHDDVCPPHSWQLTLFNYIRPEVIARTRRHDGQHRRPGTH
jgi:hypothetical protein